MVSSGADLLALFHAAQAVPLDPGGGPAPLDLGGDPGGLPGSSHSSKCQGILIRRLGLNTTHLVYLVHAHTPSLLMCPSPYPFLPLTRSSSSSSLSYTTLSYIISLSPHHTPPTSSHIPPLSHNIPCPSPIILHSLP